MAAENDLGFTFDTSFFDKGIKKVMGGFGQMETKASTVAKGVSRGLTAVVGKLGLLFAGFKSIKTALLDMPEVGQAFGIAKDVFLKNLLFPLRKEIFPLLQKMLDWVRDSRVMFVKWGANLANVFRAVVQGVKNIIGFIKRMSIVVAGFAEKIFGDRVKNINDIFNLVAFKVATVVQFVSILIDQIGGLFSGFFSGLGDVTGPLKGIIENLGEFLKIFTQVNDEGHSFKTVLIAIGELFGQIVGFIIQMTDKFLDGFVPAISQIMTPLTRIIEAWSDIRESIFGSTEALEKWGNLFEGLGHIIGTGILKTFEFIATVLEDIADTITAIKEFGLFNTLKGQTENLLGALGFGGKNEGGEQSNLAALKEQDARLFPELQTAGGNTSTTSIDFTGMNINVQNGGIEEGKEFGLGLIEQIRNEYNSEFERYGY